MQRESCCSARLSFLDGNIIDPKHRPNLRRHEFKNDLLRRAVRREVQSERVPPSRTRTVVNIDRPASCRAPQGARGLANSNAHKPRAAGLGVQRKVQRVLGPGGQSIDGLQQAAHAVTGLRVDRADAELERAGAAAGADADDASVGSRREQQLPRRVRRGAAGALEAAVVHAAVVRVGRRARRRGGHSHLAGADGAVLGRLGAAGRGRAGRVGGRRGGRRRQQARAEGGGRGKEGRGSGGEEGAVAAVVGSVRFGREEVGGADLFSLQTAAWTARREAPRRSTADRHFILMRPRRISTFSNRFSTWT